MADEGADSGETVAAGEDGAQASHEPRECMPCRGTGQVISSLGGEPKRVSCPWCGGGGLRLSGIDAQESWLSREGSPAGDAESSEPVGPPDTAG
jgi:hypothetical protein